MADADSLVHSAMKTRGHPIGGEFDDRAADLSVDHPRVVEHYRAGHVIASRDARDAASTEDLRIAMRHYRELFEPVRLPDSGLWIVHESSLNVLVSVA